MIDAEYRKWITYWKKSLSDSLKADIDYKKLQHFEIEKFRMESTFLFDVKKVNELIDHEENRINKTKGVVDKESKNWQEIHEIQIAIAPIKLKPATENLVYLKDKEPKFPFWYLAIADRTGKLKIPEETFPIFQRKYLEPLADEKTEFIFGSLENVDKAATIGKEEYKHFADYIAYLNEVFKIVVNQEIDSYAIESYETVRNAMVVLPDEDINAAIGIIHLYEKILQQKALPELLKTFITLKNDSQNLPLNVPDLINTNPLHVGQMGFDFPLSVSQRKSLYTFLKANDKVFAVNGPPGTGKTTLLQSIVANKMVESAIAGNKAPVILACSTNNQAVTNIIDSFSKSNTKPGKLQGRWIPEMEGYATYLPANGKTDAELQGINYKKQNGAGLFSRIENHEYLQKAKSFFTEKSNNYFGLQILNIEEATKKLQKEIIDIKSILTDSCLKWNDYLKTEALFLRSYITKLSEKKSYYKNGILNKDVLTADIQNLKDTEQKVLHYFNKEPFFRKLFCFLGIKSASNNRSSELTIILRDSLINITNDFVFTKSSILENLNTKIEVAKTIVAAIVSWEQWKTKYVIVGNPPKTEEEYWEFELLKVKNQSKPNCFYDELDVSLRHKAFQLALHFWEGEYLLQLEEDLSDPNFDRKSVDATKNRWQRQAMLTPCFVSTFYMAPKFFSAYLFLKKGEDGRNIFDNPPLLNFIDLLIVDEAGQVSPEVGVATFSLAKQTVIVGDVKQIEPVWNVANKIDVGNLRKCGLIKDYGDLIYEKEYDPKGFLSSTGSIMKMAQNACHFREKDAVENGVMLVEHRRCYDEIISYCNVLAYNGKLIPLKGKAKSDLLFPSMYCIHVDGNSTVVNTSRYNEKEVLAITKWLISNRKKIEERYGTVEKAVGIITPFTGQKNMLRRSLKSAGIDTDVMKIGTVHALQGAERPIILFSMVYGKGDSGTMFFDRDNKPNLLNVAVSRAKDNFIVFADTAILNKQAKTPSGILSNYLVYESKSTTL